MGVVCYLFCDGGGGGVSRGAGEDGEEGGGVGEGLEKDGGGGELVMV